MVLTSSIHGSGTQNTIPEYLFCHGATYTANKSNSSNTTAPLTAPVTVPTRGTVTVPAVPPIHAPRMAPPKNPSTPPLKASLHLTLHVNATRPALMFFSAGFRPVACSMEL